VDLNAAIFVAKWNELCFSSVILKNTQVSPNFTLDCDEILTSTCVGCEETEEDQRPKPNNPQYPRMEESGGA